MKTKRKRLLFLVLAVLLLALTACTSVVPEGTDPEPVTGEKIPSSEAEPSQTKVDPGMLDPNLPPRDGLVRSYYTNEWVDEEIAQLRPIAVMIPNENRAQPHYNLSKASIVYEAKVEGSMTRLMAIFEDWRDLEKIGNVRSIRSYYAYWAFEWDPIIVHFGGPYFVYDLLDQPTTQNIDGTLDSDAFYRSADREPPHNAFTSGAKLYTSAKRQNYATENRGIRAEQHFQFAAPGTINTLSQFGENAQAATHVDMTAAYPLTRCYFDYNDEDGLYYRSQYLSGGTDGPHVDGATRTQLSFTNLIVQRVKQEDIGDGYLAMQCHDTTKDGWFFTRGKGIHVTWKKMSDYEPTYFYDDNGNQIELNEGKTMILIIRDTDNFSYR